MNTVPTITQLLGCQKQKQFLEVFQQYVLNFETHAPSVGDVRSIFDHLGRKNFLMAMENVYPWALACLGDRLPWRVGMTAAKTPKMLEFFLSRNQVTTNDILKMFDKPFMKSQPDVFEQLLGHITKNNSKIKIGEIADMLYGYNLPKHFELIAGRVSEQTSTGIFISSVFERKHVFMELLYSPKRYKKTNKFLEEFQGAIPVGTLDLFHELHARRKAQALQETLTQHVDDHAAGVRRASKM